MAEGVEKVGAVRLFATIVPLSGACGNIDSTLPPTLNHCFKNSDLEDFFDSLGQLQTSALLGLKHQPGHSNQDPNYQTQQHAVYCATSRGEEIFVVNTTDC